MAESSEASEVPDVPPELLALRRQFVQRLPARLDDIRDLYLSLSIAEWDADGTTTLHRKVHSLTGTAGTFGLPALSDAARTLESRLSAVLRRAEAPTEACWLTIGAGVAQMHAVAVPLPEPDALPASTETAPAHHHASPWVHLVEDDAQRAAVIGRHLCETGYRVRLFNDLKGLRSAFGERDAVQQGRPSAVVLSTQATDKERDRDVLLNELGLGGRHGVPVVLVLRNDTLPARLSAARAGVNRTLTHPLQAVSALDALDALTGRVPHQPWRVLLVDDDALLLECHAGVLRAAGMVVETVSEPLQTLDAVRAFAPDVLLLDVYMPGASGPELAAALRARDAQLHLPILFLSSETDMTQQLLALNLGGDDFLIKPVRPEHLIAAVTARARRARQNTAVQQRLETTLYEREREHLALDHHAIVSMCDGAGRITYVNEMLCQVSGYQRGELVGQTFQLLVPDEHPGGNRRTVWEAVARGEVWHGEICGRRKDGGSIWTKSTVTPFMQGDGKFYQLVVVQTDISAIKLAEVAQQCQYDMQRMISVVAARLMAAPASATSEAIEACLQASAQQLGAERSDLFSVAPDVDTMVSLYNWCAPDNEVARGEALDLDIDAMPWMRDQFLTHDMVVIPDVAALPAEGAEDRRRLQALSVGALLVVPLHMNGQLVGFISYGSVHARPEWTKQKVELLRVLSDVVGSAIARKKAHSALHDSESRLNFLVSSSPVTIFTSGCRPPFTPTYVSPNVRQLMGFEPDDFLRDAAFWAEHIHIEDRALVLQELPNLFRRGKHEHEYRMQMRDGRYRWIHGQLRLVRSAKGQSAEIIGYWMDITERKRIEQELLEFNHELERRVADQTQSVIESERIARATLDAMGARVVILDERGNILAANRAWRDLRQTGPGGQTMAEGANYLAFCEYAGDTGAVAGAPIAAGIRAVIAGERQEFLHEYTDHLPGEQRWYVCRVEPFPGDGAVRVVVSHENVTQMKQIERQQMRSQRLESMGTLAGGVAHDLNNALAPVLMGMELLKEDYPKEDKLLEMMQGSARRGADMVKQLLTFAKGAEGERVALQSSRLVTELDGLMRGSFPKNIQLAVDAGSDLPTVVGDATQLHQILLNLCVNARDAMPSGGTLSLKATAEEIDAVYAASIAGARPGRYVVLRVSDTGSGIPPEILDRIFDPFFSTKGPSKGTGLGLSTVLGIVKGHGGFLQVHSKTGQGSTFSIYLPVDPEARVVEKLPDPEVLFLGKGETVLFVDDETAVREVGHKVLQRLNFKPLIATDGADGLVQAAALGPELAAVVTDLHMPHMDGLAFVRALRRTLPHVPVAVASGRLDDDVAAELLALGVRVRLDKPFTEVQLSQTLSSLIGCTGAEMAS